MAERNLRSTLFLCALIAPSANRAAAQEVAPTNPLGTVETLQVSSRFLGEDRTVYVNLPAEYGETEAPLPVLIVLDGESLLAPAVGITAFMADLLEMPPMILVGVPNRARMRDLTPAPVEGFVPPMPPGEQGFGGANAFLSFLSEEVLAEVDERYRTAPFRVLVGHSVGGLFVAHAMAERPDAFRAGLTLDPALWWNDREAISRLASTAASGDAPRSRLVSVELAGGFRADFERARNAGGERLFGELIEIQSDESHESMPIVGLREGLRTLFKDFPPRSPSPGQSAMAVLEEQYGALSDGLGYTVAIPISALNRAASMAIDGNNSAEARIVADRLRSRGRVDLANSILARIDAEEDRGDAGFVPLFIPTHRPSQEETKPFVGRWQGMRVSDPGVDSEFTLDITQAGDSILIHSTQVGPRGREFEDDRVLIGVTELGELEFGFLMRGGVGMEVATARLVDGGRRLIGTVQFRGIRIPPGATVPDISFDLRRNDGG